MPLGKAISFVAHGHKHEQTVTVCKVDNIYSKPHSSDKSLVVGNPHDAWMYAFGMESGQNTNNYMHNQHMHGCIHTSIGLQLPAIDRPMN